MIDKNFPVTAPLQRPGPAPFSAPPPKVEVLEPPALQPHAAVQHHRLTMTVIGLKHDRPTDVAPFSNESIYRRRAGGGREY